MDTKIFLSIIILFLVVTFLVKNKWVKGIFCFLIIGVVLLLAINLFVCDNAKYIQLVNKEEKIIKVRLDNKKEYYGYRFNRFSTSLTTEELLETVQESYSNAYYDEKNKRIIFEHEGISYKIVNEGESNWLWNKRTDYLFAELN